MRNARRMMVLGGLAMTAGFFAVPAPAGADNTVKTVRPDLVSASAVTPTRLRVCFDQPLASTFNISNDTLFLQGYQGPRRTGPITGFAVAGGASSVDPSDRKCAFVNFTGPGPTGDVRSFSIAVVKATAVTDTNGIRNTENSVPIDGSLIPSPPGLTARPELTGTTVDQGNGQMTFTFDKTIAGIVDVSRLGFYSGDPNDAGRPFHRAAAVDHLGRQPTFSGNSVTVGFSAADLVYLPQARRFAVDEDAITSGGADTNTTGATGGTSGRPTLNGAAFLGRQIANNRIFHQYAYDFSTAVNEYADAADAAAAARQFQLYDAAGTRITADNAPAFPPNPVNENRFRVIVTYDVTTGLFDPGHVTRAAVREGAVFLGPANARSTNEIGAAGVTPSADFPGKTSAPDLVAVNLERGSAHAFFRFDEFLSFTDNCFMNIPGLICSPSPNEEEFALIDSNGNLTRGTQAFPVLSLFDPSSTKSDTNIIRVTFTTGAVNSAVAGIVLDGTERPPTGPAVAPAVTDNDGEPNTIGATRPLNLRDQALPPAAPPTTPPPTPVTATGQPRRYVPGMETSVTPRRDTRAPFTFTTSGRLITRATTARARSSQAGTACRRTGNVSVQIKRGTLTLSTRRQTINRDCTFRITTRFAKASRFRKHRSLRVLVKWNGNRQLKPTATRVLTVRVK